MVKPTAKKGQTMDFDKIIEDGECLAECVGLIATSPGVLSVTAVRFEAPFPYVRVWVVYTDDFLQAANATFDIQANRRANWAKTNPMFVTCECE